MFNFFYCFFFLNKNSNNKKLCSIFIFSENTKMKDLWSIFIFFCTQNGNETNTEIKKNSQSRYNRFPRSCCHLSSCSSVSVAVEEDYIIFEWIVERRVKKKKMTAERLVQMFRVSHAEDYCNWADFFQCSQSKPYTETSRKRPPP